MKRTQTVAWVLFLIAIAIVIATWFFFFPNKSVPEEFFGVRDQGAEFAREIVRLSRQSLTRLTQISELDQERDFTKALELVSEELVENQKSQEVAAQLASQLEIMARLLPEIKPQRAREIAAEAVSAEVALVSRLVTYNDRLRDLFIVLQLKFNTRNSSGELDGRVNELINEINEQAKAINQFNQRFNEAMEEFDTIFK